MEMKNTMILKRWFYQDMINFNYEVSLKNRNTFGEPFKI